MNVKLVVGHSWSQLAHDVAAAHNADFIPLVIRQFADKEISVSLSYAEKIDQQDALLVYQISRQAEAGTLNDQAIGLFATVHQIKKFGARSIRVLLPYMPYGRQDNSGLVFMIGQCLKGLGVDELIVCDLHEPSIISNFPIKISQISFDSFWATVITERIIKTGQEHDFCIVSPDEGGRGRAESVAKMLGVSSAFIRKNRVSVNTARARELIGDVAGKRVILVDDIIDTGNTAMSAVDLLLRRNAAEVVGCFSHGVLSKDAIKKIDQSPLQQFLITGTIDGISNHESKKLSVIALSNRILQSKLS